MHPATDHHTWAFEQTAAAKFGDVRRRARMAAILRRALAKPGGKLTEVFDSNAELQGAYDFVQGSVPPVAIVDAIGHAACADLASDSEGGFIVLDGTSLSLTDRTGRKGFGAIGKRGLPTRGLKVIDALAVSSAGLPIGLVDLQFWARGKKSKLSRYYRRLYQQTETRHWVDSIVQCAERVRAHVATSSCCIVIDREGDNAEVFRTVRDEGFSYIIRVAQKQRPVVRANGKRRPLKTELGCQPVTGVRVVDVPAGPHRVARQAELDVRVARVVIDLPDRRSGARMPFETNVVWAVERRPPHGEQRLDWMLLTDKPIDDFDAATKALDGYCLRWRIEDFHRSWKSGRCNVEDMQLRAADHVARWATLLATVAVRIEQLKHLARNEPDAPATDVFTPIEIEALKAAKTRQKKRTETIPDGVPTIGQAVRWLGDLGGYQGKGIPGSLTLGRGLERFTVWAEGFAAAYAAQAKSRRK